MREKILSVLALMSISQAFAQDNLINALANNQGKDVQKYYQIKPVFAVGVTDVKDQGHSGTCWSYAGSSFLESEMIKKKKQPVDLGAVPKTFMYNGKMYTPETFGKEVVGLQDEKYMSLISIESRPKYCNTLMAVPDNWCYEYAFNVTMEDLIRTIDYALSKGYTVGWGADVSEKSFSWRNGLALVPEKDYKDLSEAEQKDYFHVYWNEKQITPQMRQEAFDNYETTDDHAMQIVGLAKDQKGREYYIVKNSWGTSNDNKGYLYVSKNYVRYKTMNIIVNQKGTPKDLVRKFKKAPYIS